jgi:hypothetical protein
MVTKRKLRTRKMKRLSPLADWQIGYLQTGIIPDDSNISGWHVLIFCYGGSTHNTLDAKDTWPHVRDEILRDWIDPKTRPWAWWKFEQNMEMPETAAKQTAYLKQHNLLQSR